VDVVFDSYSETERRLRIMYERAFHDFALEIGGFWFLGRSYRTYVAWTMIGQSEPRKTELV